MPQQISASCSFLDLWDLQENFDFVSSRRIEATEAIKRKKKNPRRTLPSAKVTEKCHTSFSMQWEPHDNEFFGELVEEKLEEMTHDEKVPSETRNAVDFTVHTDDGARPEKLEEADIILVGVSGTTKTTLAHYLAKHYSSKVKI
jgi:hypothetical protein